MEFKDFFQKLLTEEQNTDQKQWVHHSKVPYLKFNPNQFHSDPAGYYFFPRNFKPVEYWRSMPYTFYVSISPDAKILYFDKVSVDEVVKMAKLAKVGNKLKGDIDKYPAKSAEDLFDRLWDILRNGPFVRRPAAFNKFFRNLGYDAIFDNTKSIHVSEEQLIILNPKIITSISMDKKKFNAYEQITKVMNDLATILKPYGEIEIKPPRNVRQWGEELLEGTVEVKNGDKYAIFSVAKNKKDTNRQQVNIHLKYTNLQRNGSVPNYDLDLTTGEFNRPWKKIQEHIEEFLAQMNPKAVKESIDDDIRAQQQGSQHHQSSGQSKQFWGDRGAGVIIQCAKTKRYLLGLRSQYVNEPNTWGTFGGMIDKGEDPLEAVRREIEEEIGVSQEIPIKLFDTFEKGTFKFYNFYGVVQNEFKPELDWENADARWFSKGDFPPNLHFGLKRLVPKLP